MEYQTAESQKLVDVDQVDSHLLQYNLSLSYEQRLVQHQIALDMMTMLRDAGAHYHAKSQQSASVAPGK